MKIPPRLIAGPYRPPAARSHRPGRSVQCRVRGEVTVTGTSDAPIPWPLGTTGRGAYRRPPHAPLPVVTDELARAIRTESRQAVAHWWGVSESTAWRWRRALGVARYNAGTVERWRELSAVKLTDEGRRKALAVYRRGLRRRRRLRERPTIAGE